jgi:hypothetical protein
MDAGQIIEADLPYSADSFVEAIQLQPVSAGSDYTVFAILLIDDPFPFY